MSIEVGDPAPDFELFDSDMGGVKLSDFRGKNVALVFFPLAFSGTCTAELCGIRDDIQPYQNDDVVTLAVSIDSFFALKAFKEQQGYTFTMLSDFWPHGATARAYGVFDEPFGVAQRATFLIDRDGIVRHKVVSGMETARDQEAITGALRSLT